MNAAGWQPRDEVEAVGAVAVLLEWLAAVHARPLAGPAALAAWARADRPGFRAAFAAFAALPDTDARLLDDAAGWLLGAGIRPDDRVVWLGPPADPALAALAAIGGRLAPAGRPFTAVPTWP
jgi:hypothetical protein